MTEQVINAGDEVDSYCTTCKLILAHQVVALVDGEVEKVVCKTCGKQHKYRPNPPRTKAARTAKVAGAKKTTVARKRKTKDTSEKWEERLAGKDLSLSKPYSFSGEFQTGEVIDHRTFGHGMVTEIIGEGKMEVMFKDGKKVLVYGKK